MKNNAQLRPQIQAALDRFSIVLSLLPLSAIPFDLYSWGGFYACGRLGFLGLLVLQFNGQYYSVNIIAKNKTKNKKL
jgi:hypothetical protein